MDSVSLAEKPASSATADVNAVFELPPPDLLPAKSAFDKPPSTPATEIDSILAVTVSNVTTEEPGVVVTELRSPAVVIKSDNDHGHRQTPEQGQLVTRVPEHNGEQAEAIHGDTDPLDTQRSNANTEDNHSLAAAAGGDQKCKRISSVSSSGNIEETAVDPSCGLERQGGSSNDTKGIPPLTQDAKVLSEASSSEVENEFRQVNENKQIGDFGEEASADDSVNGSLGIGEEAVAKTQDNKGVADVSSRSIPPHMRPALNAPNAQQHNAPEARSNWPVPAPRVPRSYFPPAGHQPFRAPIDYDELQRTKAQLMKACSDLEAERKINTVMRKTIGAEKQASIGAALAEMLSDLLQKQADALTAKASAQEKDRDLQYREQRITQLETYLSEGQKQLKWQLEQQGIRTMSDVEEASLRRDVEMKMKHHLSNIEGKIKIQIERLRHQEAAQKIREQQYKALFREALEDEIREQLEHDRQAKIADTRVVEPVFERGVVTGRDSAVAKSSEAEDQQGFLKGYAACYRTLTVLHNVRNGKIAVDSPEMAFLFDPTHSENPHNVGLNIGRIEAVVEKFERTVSRAKLEEVVPRGNAVQGKSATDINGLAHRVRDQEMPNDACSRRSSGPVDQVRSTQQAQQDQLGRSYVPPRYTFAGELRASSSTATTSGGTMSQFTSKSHGISAASATRTSPRASAVDHANGGAYSGRQTVRYNEDHDNEPAALNLIDLC